MPLSLKESNFTYILILRMAVNFQSTHDLWGELKKGSPNPKLPWREKFAILVTKQLHKNHDTFFRSDVR